MHPDTRLDRLRQRTANVRYRPRVVCLVALDRLIVAGDGMAALVAIAGGSYDAVAASDTSQEWTWEQLAVHAPEVILVMPRGLGLEQIRAALPELTRHPVWASLPAVQNRRVYAVDGNLYCDPAAPCRAEDAELLAALIQPGRCASLLPPDSSFRIEM